MKKNFFMCIWAKQTSVDLGTLSTKSSVLCSLINESQNWKQKDRFILKTVSQHSDVGYNLTLLDCHVTQSQNDIHWETEMSL